MPLGCRPHHWLQWCCVAGFPSLIFLLIADVSRAVVLRLGVRAGGGGGFNKRGHLFIVRRSICNAMLLRIEFDAQSHLLFWVSDV